MFGLLKIFLAFAAVNLLFASDLQNNFKIFSPEFIPSGGRFEISVITSKVFPESDRLDLYLIPDPTLMINKIELWTVEGKSNIQSSARFLENFSVTAQIIQIDLTDSASFTSNSFFQIVVQLTSNPATANKLKIYGEFLETENVVGYLVSSDNNLVTNRSNLYSLSFEYYEKYPVAGNAALFHQNSYLNLPLDYEDKDVLAAEFWIRLEDFNSTFLKLINLESSRTEYYLSRNENQMLMITSGENNFLEIKPVFFSSEVWYHLILVINKTNSEISFICNGEEITKIENVNFFDFGNLGMHFQNEGTHGNFVIDQLRLVEIKGSASGLNTNRNYSEYSDDSSSVLLQFNFLEDELNSSLNRRESSHQELRLIKSDAPIFPRSPEVSVNLSSNFFEVEWSGGDVKNASYYVLEKAVGNSEFIQVGRLTAEDEQGKKYSLLSENNNLPEIIYFRIKQVNKDGTKVYSDAVKIGQGIIEDVIIGQNYPNPFNPTTLIEFELLQDTDIELKIFNLAGNEIIMLHNGFLNKGIHQFKFDATGLPSGIYLYQVTTPLNTQTQKMILAK